MGSKLSLDLRRCGHNVTILDNLSTLRYATLFTFRSGNPIRFIEGDILTYPLGELCRDVDVVIHLAAITDAANTLDIPEKVYETNYIGTLKVAEECVEHNCKLLFPSSTSVYGVNGDKEVDETCMDLHPQSPYASSKLEACTYIRNRHGLTATILRLGTVYGVSAGWRCHTFVNKAVWSATTGLPVSIWETAMDQRRPYLYIGDAISAMLHVIHKGLWGELYCVVSQNATPREVVGILKRYKPDVQIKITRSPIMNQNSYTVSAKKFRATGWTPQGDLAAGIKQTLDLLSGIHG